MASYSFNITWNPGKTHFIADALSRAPVFKADNDEEYETFHIASPNHVVSAVNTAIKLDDFVVASQDDEEYQQLLSDVKSAGKKGSPTTNLRRYKKILNNVSIHHLNDDKELLAYDSKRLIVPASLQAASLL